MIYTGRDNFYEDKQIADGQLYEYAVSVSNKNGESNLSYPVHTNPDSWLHWNPKPGERFRRTNTLNDNTEKGNIYYPE